MTALDLVDDPANTTFPFRVLADGRGVTAFPTAAGAVRFAKKFG